MDTEMEMQSTNVSPTPSEGSSDTDSSRDQDPPTLHDDPAKMLPYECRIEEDDPNVEKLPKVFKGRMGEGFLDEQPRYNTNI